jgi:hypothetical protein
MLSGRRWPWILGRPGHSLALAGKTGTAMEIAQEIRAQEGPAVQIAFIQAAPGRKRQAIDELERAVPRHEMDLNSIAVEPMLASIRREARFVALRSRLGL